MGMINCDTHGPSFLAFIDPKSTYKKQRVLHPDDWVFLEIPGGGLPMATLKSVIAEKSDQERFIFRASTSGELVIDCARCFEEKMGGRAQVNLIERIEVNYGLGDKGDLDYFFDLVEENVK